MANRQSDRHMKGTELINFKPHTLRIDIDMVLEYITILILYYKI
jgi:hypothetical protein